MTKEQILDIVQAESKASFNSMMSASKGMAYDAKCIAILIMKEENYSVWEIAIAFGVKPPTANYQLERAENMLTLEKWMPGYSREFKDLYLGCITRVTQAEEMEDNAIDMLCAEVVEIKSDVIINVVCRITRIEKDLLLSESRIGPVKTARFMAVLLLKKLKPEISDSAIGRLLNRDHSTIIYAGKAAPKLLLKSDFKNKYKMALEVMGGAAA